MKRKKATLNAGKRAFTDAWTDNGKRFQRQDPRRVFRQPKTELEQAIQRYIDLFDFAPMGTLRSIALAGLKKLISQPFGYSAGRAGNDRDHLRYCVAKEDTQLFLNIYVTAVLGKLVITSESKAQRRRKNSGTVVKHDVSPDEDGRPCTRRDCRSNERKRFEEKIQRSQERYRTLFDLVPVAVYTCNATGSSGIQPTSRRTVGGELGQMEKSRDSAAPTKSIIPTAGRCRMKNARWPGRYAAKSLHRKTWKLLSNSGRGKARRHSSATSSD